MNTEAQQMWKQIATKNPRIAASAKAPPSLSSAWIQPPDEMVKDDTPLSPKWTRAQRATAQPPFPITMTVEETPMGNDSDDLHHESSPQRTFYAHEEGHTPSPSPKGQYNNDDCTETSEPPPVAPDSPSKNVRRGSKLMETAKKHKRKAVLGAIGYIIIHQTIRAILDCVFAVPEIRGIGPGELLDL